MNAGRTCLSIITGLAAILVTCGSSPADDTEVTTAQTPSTKGENRFYVGNRSPLLPSPLIKLPIGLVKPHGWLRQQLVLEADGMIGHLPEISKWCKFKGNAWVDPTGQGQSGWEELPYWLKGYVALGAVLEDKRILDESKKWLEAVLASQQEDGYFGPQANKDNHDHWPNMPMLYALRTYHEITNDRRILDCMSRYFRWQSTVPFEHLMARSWQNMRACDNLDSVYWLYNRTGDARLLDFARVNHEVSAQWMLRLQSAHGVNVAECFREPGQYWQQAHDVRYLRAAERNYDEFYRLYGQMPGGMFAADEVADKAHNFPRNGAETCAHVEMMHSAEMMLAMTGDIQWADRCEDVAFNTLPASMTADLKALHYITCPNQVQLDNANKAPMIRNEGDMFTYSPYEQYRCCQHNVAFGWPYFAERLWMATAGNGLAAAFYAASAVTAKVGDGSEVTIVETTDYPFGETVSLKIDTAQAVRFPLTLRIPGWCEKASLTLNGQAVDANAKAGQWVTLTRLWQKGDTVELRLPMRIQLRTWTSNANSVSVDRGPLTYSLKIGEKWERYMPGPADDQPPRSEDWPSWQVFPTTAWNYALIVDAQAPEESFAITGGSRRVEPQPFTPEAAPIVLKAKGRKVPAWKLEANGLIGMQPNSPVPVDQLAAETEDLTLIPMGCARLRVSAFPVAGQGAD